MTNSNTILDFFISGNTPFGLMGDYSFLIERGNDWKIYILDGASEKTRGKILDKLFKKACKKYINIEKIHFPNFPQISEALFINDIKTAFVSKTYYNYINILYPNCNHIIVPFQCALDNDVIWENRNEIIKDIDDINKIYENFKRFLKASLSISNDTYSIALDATNVSKIYTLAGRISLKEFGKNNDKIGREETRYISAITPDGVMGFYDTIINNSDKIYVLQDDLGPSSQILIQALKAKAMNNGFDVISCTCPTSPKMKSEHLIIPELKLAFVTSNKFHNIEILQPYRIINSRRFTDFSKLKLKKKHLSFNKKVSEQMLSQSIEILNDIKTKQELLVQTYDNATNFDKIKEIENQLLNLIW